MNSSTFVKTLVKLNIILLSYIPVLLHRLFIIKTKKDGLSTGLLSSKKIVYFDRAVPDETKDAGSGTILGLLSFFKEKAFIVESLILSDKPEPFNVLSFLQQTKTTFFKVRNIISLRKRLGGFDIILVKSPESCLLLILIMLFNKKLPTIWFYGGDIYHHRFKTGLVYKQGFDYIKSYIQYLTYALLEPLLWKSVEACLSPSLDEANFIRKYNASSLVLPIRMFKNLDSIRLPFIFQRDTDSLEMIFVGGTGHSPNIKALKKAVTEILPFLLNEVSSSIIFNVVGQGWKGSEFSSWLGNNPHCIIHGSVTDKKLKELYEGSLFALLPIQDGAGVKGKVIDAMYAGIFVVTTTIGTQGIPDEIIPSLETDKEMADYINELLSDLDKQNKTLTNYKRFLADNYSKKAYENLLSSLLI